MKANNVILEKKLNSNYPIKISITQREKTKKASPEIETLSPIAVPELDTNLNSVSNKLDLEHDNEHFIQSIDFKKVKSFKINDNNNKGISRADIFGNPILKNGKHKISFIDKISANNFVDVIQIESFKDYNKMEEISNYNNMQNNCCFVI